MEASEVKQDEWKFGPIVTTFLILCIGIVLFNLVNTITNINKDVDIWQVYSIAYAVVMIGAYLQILLKRRKMGMYIIIGCLIVSALVAFATGGVAYGTMRACNSLFFIVVTGAFLYEYWKKMI